MPTSVGKQLKQFNLFYAAHISLFKPVISVRWQKWQNASKSGRSAISLARKLSMVRYIIWWNRVLR
jgi:hypothetical protein